MESAIRNTYSLCPIPSSFLTPSPRHVQVPATPLWGGGVLSFIGGATLKKEVGGGNPTPGDRSPWGFSKLFQPRCSTSFGCSRHSFTARGPPGTGGCGPMQKTGHQVHGAGLIGWHTLPSSVSPVTVHPWETSLPGLQGCASSPGHQSLRGTELTFTF